MTIENPSLMSDPRMAIEEIRARVMAMGANDSENRRINEIITELNKGDKGIYKNPEDAVKAAQEILDGKQDYH